jgi:hypothetical protein
MIRDEVLFYATIALLAFLAFYLMPTYERMTDGIEVDPRNKAATSPTTAQTPQIAYPSKASFGPSHISPILDHKASEMPMRPSFPSFEQFTTMEEKKPNPNNVVPHSKPVEPSKPIPAKPVEPSKPNHTPSKPNHTPSKPNHTPSKPNHGGGGGGGGNGNGGDDSQPQPYTSRGDIYNLPTVTGDNTPPLTPSTQTSGGVGASPSPVSSYSGSGFQQSTLAAPSPVTGGANSSDDDPLNQYVLKSSLVPYVCPSGACGTPNQLPSSKTPGDMDMPDYTRMKPNQKNMGRPRNEAFAQKSDEPQPFLTDFAPFTK